MQEKQFLGKRGEDVETQEEEEEGRGKNLEKSKKEKLTVFFFLCHWSSRSRRESEEWEGGWTNR